MNGGMKTIKHSSTSIQNAVFLALQMAKRKIENPTKKFLIPWIISSPGIGKTEMIIYYASKKGFAVLPCEPGLEREEKFGGLPDSNIKIISQKETLTTEWSMPELVCKLWEMSEQNPNGVICFMDDIHTCSEAVQNIQFELFTHNSISGHKIPNNVAIILAGNETPMAGARITFTAIRNRCMALYAEPDVKFWLQNYAVPNGVHDTICSFFSIIDHESYFCTEESNFEQFASPRSWDQGVSEFLWNLEKTNKMDEIKTDPKLQNIMRCALEGCVGSGPANKFIEYLLIYKDIDVSPLFDKGILNVPEDPIRKMAYSTIVVSEFYQRKSLDLNDKNASNSFIKVLNYFMNNNKELSIKMMYHLCGKTTNEKLNLISGLDIIKSMINNHEIDSSVIKNMQVDFSIIKQY